MVNTESGNTTNLDAWLPIVRQHHTDPKWLDATVEDLHWLISVNSHPRSLQNTMSILQLILPHFLWRPDAARWVRQLHQLRNIAANGHCNETQREIWQYLGDIYLLKGQLKWALTSFQNAADRAQAEDARIQALAGILKVAAARNCKADSAVYQDLIRYVDTTPNLYVRSNAQHALARYHLEHEAFQLVLDNISEVAIFWQNQLERSQRRGAVSHNTLAHYLDVNVGLGIVNQIIGEYDTAHKHLNHVCHLAEMNRDYPSFIAAHTELAILEHQQGNLDTAINHIYRMVPFVDAIHDHVYKTRIKFIQGLVMSELGIYEPAADLLAEAILEWQSRENPVKTAYTQLAYAHVSLMSDDHPNTTKYWLNMARESINVMPQSDSSRREHHRKQMIAQLQKDAVAALARA
jgi:tetratricopeptide (TPR) repeat protein